MKYVFVLAALAALVAAQDPSVIPECARDCLTKATASATTCKEGDYACTCKPDNKAAIQTAATSCVVAACGVEKAVNEVIPASEKLCAAAASGGGAASSAASAVSSAAASVSIPTSASGSANLPFTTAPSPTVTDVVITSAATPATTRSPTGGNASSGSPPSTTAVPAGAAGLAPLGSLAMLALGALAL